MVLFAALTLIVLSSFLLLVHNPRRVPQIAVVTCLLLAALIPSFGPSVEYQITLALGSVAVALIAVLRTIPEPGNQLARTNVWIILYLFYAAAIALVYLSPTAAALRATTTIGLVLIVVLARRASSSGTDYFPAAVTLVVVTEVVLGTSEAFFGADAVWPRPDGSDRLENRVNHLAPWLPGRVLGSLAGPIPYGTIAGIGLLVALWMVFERRQTRYVYLLGFSAFGLLLSGTRSAILAVVVVGAIWIVGRSSASRPVVIVLGIAAGAVFVMLSDLSTLFGLQGIENTNSFEHRNEILGSVSQILTRQGPLPVIFGNGDNARDLLTSGVITSTTGVTVYDNQFVRELAASGIVGVLLLSLGVMTALRRGNGLSRMIVVFIVMMFFSFDALTWRSVIVIFLIACAGPLAPKPSSKSEIDAEAALSTMAPRGRYAS